MLHFYFLSDNKNSILRNIETSGNLVKTLKISLTDNVFIIIIGKENHVGI